MRFAEPWALLALLLVPAVFVVQAILRARRQRHLAEHGDVGLLSALTDGGPRLRQARGAQAALFAAALGLVAVALARPQFGMRTEIRRGRGMDVVVALDLSKSMYARDVVPSRLERAKIELGVLLDQLRGDRVGLVGFTSIGLPLCPLTVDHAALRIQLKGAEPGDLPRGGTSVSSAIAAARKMLEAAGHDEADKGIVIITDGEAHLGDPVQAAADAREAGIVVHVVGVGSRVGEPIPEIDKRGKVVGYVRDRQGKTVVSRLDESTLRQIAEAGGGKVALPSGEGGLDLGPVARHLASLRKVDLESRTVRVYEERYAWALVPAFLCLLLATLVRPTRRPGLPRMMLGLALGLAAWPQTASAQGFFQREHPKVEEGIQALQNGQGERAKQAFEEATKILGESPTLTYDRALADAARGELEPAMEGFKAAAERSEDPSLRAKARVALGNALRKLKKYQDAADAYREAMLDDPSLESARRNLELASAMKRIQDAQPPSDQDEEGEGEPPDDEDQPGDDQPDAGTSDGGDSDAGPEADAGGGDGGESSPDAGTGDGGQGEDAGGSSESSGDAGTGPEAGAPPSEGAPDAGADAGAPPPQSESPDAGPKEAGAGASGAEPEAPPPDLSRQEAEAILDALQAEEEALERKRLLQRFEGRAVEKDW